jgi:cytoskeleton protein RodZ
VETLGAYLKTKRESLNISLQEISQVTRIRRSILEAIENNRYDLLPPKVFAQGFIKSYASYLGLDESEVIRRYFDLVEKPDAEVKAAAVREPAPPARLSFIIKLIVLAGLFLAAVLLWRMSSHDKDAAVLMPQQQVDLTTTSMVSVAPPVGEPAEGGSGQEREAAPAESAPPLMGTAGTPATAMVAALPSAPAAQQSSASAEQPLTATVTQRAETTAEKPPADSVTPPLALKIVASQSTWMRIQSDTERPIEFTLKGGQTHTVNAMEKFIIRIGNAGGVDLFLNDQELGKPGRPGEVLELTLPE